MTSQALSNFLIQSSRTKINNTHQQLEPVFSNSTSSLFWFVQVTDLHLSVLDQERISGGKK
jgi:hypothetical protein